jgi:scyllo-inositol 2-dehydrogenase (NADP+)
VARAGRQLTSTARVALVGYGMGGSVFHAPFIHAEGRLELASVVTGNAERRAEVLARYPGTQVDERVEDLLDRLDDIDLVVVSTPNATHVAVAEAVLSNRRPVVVDKPVTPSADETRRLAVLAAAAGTAVVPFQNRRWDGDFRTVVDLLGDQALGTLHTFESRYERWRPHVSHGPVRAWKNDPEPGAGGGILYDLGTHLIDQAVALFGRPQAVFADIAIRRADSGVDDDVFLALHYPGGPRVHLWASAVAADQGPRFRLLGDAAAYVKFGMDVQEAALSAGQSPAQAGWGEEPESSWGHLVTGVERRAVPTLAGAYGFFYAGMASFLLDGAPPPVDVADAIVSAEVIEAARASSQSGVVAPVS